MVRRVYMSTVVPTSTPTDEKKEGSHHGGEVTESEGRMSEGKIYRRLCNEVHEYSEGLSDIEQVYNSIMEIVIDKNGTIDKPCVQMMFHLLMKIGVEKIRGDVRNPQRRFVGQVLCRCLQHADMKEDGIRGVGRFCTNVVEEELWEDNLLIWELVAEVIGWSIMCDTQYFGGERPSLGDFKEVFREAEADLRKPNALLVNVLKRLAEIEKERDGHVSSTAMALEESKDLLTDSLEAELRSCHLSPEENLYQLLLN